MYTSHFIFVCVMLIMIVKILEGNDIIIITFYFIHSSGATRGTMGAVHPPPEIFM